MCRRAAEEEKKEEAGDIVKPIPGLVIPVKVDPKLGGPSVQVQMVYSYVFHESFYLYVVWTFRYAWIILDCNAANFSNPCCGMCKDRMTRRKTLEAGRTWAGLLRMVCIGILWLRRKVVR